MALQDILAALLNPNGAFSANRLASAGAPAQVGDHANPAMLPGFQSALQAPEQALAAPQAPQGQPMPQSAPQGAPEPSGGGIGGLLSGLFQGPKTREKNYTIGWLQKQGMDEGMATLLAGSKPALQQYLLQRQQGQKPIEINGRLVDPNTYEVIADFSDKTQPNRQTATIDGKLVDTNTGQVIGDYGSSERTSTMTPEEVAAAGLPPGVYQRDKEGKISAVGSVRDQDAGFKNEMELRKEYDMLPEVKDYKVVRSNYERIRQGVQLGTGAGDAAIVFGYMKMLDPTSVVREGEQATTRNAAGVPEAIRGMYNQLIGGGQLSGEARQQILGAAEKVYGESSTNIEDVNKRYGDYAGAWKLDPSRIVSSPEQYDPLQPPVTDGNLPLPPPGAPGGPAAVTPGGQRVIKQMTNPDPVKDWKEIFGKKSK